MTRQPLLGVFPLGRPAALRQRRIRDTLAWPIERGQVTATKNTLRPQDAPFLHDPICNRNGCRRNPFRGGVSTYIRREAACSSSDRPRTSDPSHRRKQAARKAACGVAERQLLRAKTTTYSSKHPGHRKVSDEFPSSCSILDVRFSRWPKKRPKKFEFPRLGQE
jgi:hypothetical protein